MSSRMRMQSLLAVLFVFGFAQVALAEATGSFSKQLTVSGNAQVEIQTGSGNITVRTGSNDHVNIEAHIKANDGGWGWNWISHSNLSPEERVKRIAANPPITQNGNSIIIGKIEDEELRDNVSISYDVTVPADTRLETRSGSGGQRIEDLRGPVVASTGSGTIEIGQIGGEVEAKTGSGGIKINGANGDVNARAGSGHISLHNIKAGLRASTGSGGIDADGDASRDWDLHTGSGSITVRTPSQASFRLDAASGSGGVSVDKPVTMQGSIRRNHVEGTVGSGGNAMITLRTGSGGIHVE